MTQVLTLVAGTQLLRHVPIIFDDLNQHHSCYAVTIIFYNFTFTGIQQICRSYIIFGQ